MSLPRPSKENVIYERCTARTKFYSRDKGFGFLKRPNKPDIFVGQRELNKAGIPFVKEGDLLEFDIFPGKDNKNSQAINIKRVTK